MNNLRTLQLQMVEMITVVDNLFKSHNIFYTLLGGSVLGAVRHRGFIPWDDDMDIGIQRKDFDKAEKLLASLKLYVYEFSEQRTIPDAPVGHLRTKGLGVSRTATIDVFALDYVPAPSNARKYFHFYTNIYHVCVLRRAPVNRGIIKKITMAFVLFLCPNTVLDYFQTLAKKKILNPSIEQDGFLGNIFGAWGSKEYFPEEIYLNVITMAFEGIDLPVPASYDRYLSQLYGDYMLLPPLEERLPKHLK